MRQARKIDCYLASSGVAAAGMYVCRRLECSGGVQAPNNELSALIAQKKNAYRKKKLEQDLQNTQSALQVAQRKLTGLTSAQAQDAWPEVCNQCSTIPAGLFYLTSNE